MTERWDTATKPGGFERLLEGPCCPAPGEILLAISAEFRSVDAAWVSFRFDELARGLFDVALCREPRAAAHALAMVLTGQLSLRSEDSRLDGLWVDCALERRVGHPLALAVIAAEIGRRAGIPVGVCSTEAGWYAGIGEPARLWLIDPATDAGPTPEGPVRSHCGHEVAFAALTGIYARLVRDGDAVAAHRAARLRGRLPVTRHDPRSS